MTLPLAALLQGAVAGGPTGQTYVDDVFSTYLYTGNGSTQTITNGIDLAGKGGLVWNKCRSHGTSSDGNWLHDSARGQDMWLCTNWTDAQWNQGGPIFNSNGWAYNAGANAENVPSQTYVSWTFRKAAKFFDVVTWSGDGTNNRVLSHALGIQPGMIVVKRYSGGTENWPVWHRSVSAGSAGNLFLNLTNALGGAKIADADATTFTLGTSDTSHNAVGSSYVAYLFAHDTGTDGIIQCGSFLANASSVTTTLNWEPQLIMFKRSDSTGNWRTLDSSRGWPATGNPKELNPNLSAAETSNGGLNLTATGFINGINDGGTYIYLAIRRPNKPPTSGTQVYNALTYTGTNTNNRKITGVGFSPDASLICYRGGGTIQLNDRLRGPGQRLLTNGTDAEINQFPNYHVKSFDMDGYTQGDLDSGVWNSSSGTLQNWFFRRAPGVFDVVCGDSGNATVARAHSLGVKPELIIAKYRDIASQWDVYCDRLNGGVNQEDYYLELNGIFSQMSSTDVWGAAGPSASYFYKSVVASYKAVFYLFATKAGISKVGSYTGNGSNQTINCGFTTGARFVLIKRTDATGDWYVWDSTRGIVAGDDPHLSLNTTAAEVTTDDSIDPDNSGFIVNQLAATNINVTSATYIYLAFA